MIESEPRKWTWTYHALADRGALIGWWTHDDDRDLYKAIKIRAMADQSYQPYVPYWSGFPGGPEFGHPSDFPRRGTLKEAIAYCETYLAKDEKDW
jgi:hypothetical protein